MQLAGSPIKRRLQFAAFLLVGGGVLVALLGGLVLWSGVYDIAATAKHPWPVASLLHYAMERSVAHNAPTLTPPDLNDEILILRGGMHFSTGCAPCHGAPGQLASPIAQQMTPVPPGLYSAYRDFTPSQLFFIVKNGVKMTAMPAWPAQMRDDEVWAMVAFLEHLQDYTPPTYAALLTGSRGSTFLAGNPTPQDIQSAFDPAPCAGCHGSDGRGRGTAFPPIAGLNAESIADALNRYRDGSRPSGFMQPVAAAMSEAQIDAAATYYSRLVTTPTAAPASPASP